jgi:hypothetical protein
VHKQATTRTRSVIDFDVRFCVLFFILAALGTEAIIGCGPCDEFRAHLALLRWRLGFSRSFLVAHGYKYTASAGITLLITDPVPEIRMMRYRVGAFAGLALGAGLSRNVPVAVHGHCA